MTSSSSTFSFTVGSERLNWQLLVALDISRIIRTVDVDALQGIIQNITFAKLNREEIALFQPEHTLHLLTLCQLIIQYLIHTQNFLTSQVDGLQKDAAQMGVKLNEAIAELGAARAEAKAAKKELKRLEHMTAMCDQWFGGQGNNNNNNNGGGQLEQPPTLPCPQCGRVFQTAERLSAHTTRCSAKTESLKSMTELKKEMERWQLDQQRQHAESMAAMKDMILSVAKTVTSASGTTESRASGFSEVPLILQMQNLQKENDSLRRQQEMRGIEDMKAQLGDLRTLVTDLVKQGIAGRPMEQHVNTLQATSTFAQPTPPAPPVQPTPPIQPTPPVAPPVQ
eukprot:PhF_6_TR1396/c1_g1_i2/m.2417/K16470/DZIP1; zinc finger protein DZIP1